jgi:peptidoglycan/LPS O-acetylase OafA/YrhL
MYHAGYAYFCGGYVGVDVFFVISGFLITSIIFEEMENKTFTIAKFYERRARRILPALFFVLLCSIPFAWRWLMPSDLKDFTESLWSVLYFGSNFLFWRKTDYFQTAADLRPLLHTWSLSVEEQFYIIYPPILMYLRRFGPKFVLICLTSLLLASLFTAQWGVNNAPRAAFFLLPHRGWELLVGALAALYYRSRRAPLPLVLNTVFSLLGIALIFLPVFIYDGRTPFPGKAALVPVVGAGLILLFSDENNLVGRALSARPLVWIGLISYSAYLWHQVIFALFKQRFGSQLFDSYAPLLIAIAFGLACVSYWLVERPFRRRATVTQLIAVMTSCCIVAAAAGVVFEEVINRDKMLVPSYRMAVSLASPELLSYVERRDVEMECSPDVVEFGFRQCKFGDASQPKQLALWGDSLGAALLYGLDQIGKERGIGGMAFLADGCPPVLGLRNTIVPQCTIATNGEILKRIEQDPDFKRVLIVGNMIGAMHAPNVKIDNSPSSPAVVRERIATAASELRSRGKTTYLLEQGPSFPESVSQYEFENLRHGGDEPPLVVSRASHAAAVADVKVLRDVVDRYIGMESFYCDENSCSSYDRAGKMIVWDTVHPTRYGAIKIARHIIDVLRQ